MGESQLKDLSEHLSGYGLQFVWVRKDGDGMPQPNCSGIGGSGKWLGITEVPCGVAGVNGILKLTVLKDDPPQHTIPLLLPINLQESLGMKIDLETNRLSLGSRWSDSEGNPVTVDMERLMPSKHRTISITDFDEDGWSALEGSLSRNGELMDRVFRVAAKRRNQSAWQIPW